MIPTTPPTAASSEMRSPGEIVCVLALTKQPVTPDPTDMDNAVAKKGLLQKIDRRIVYVEVASSVLSVTLIRRFRNVPARGATQFIKFSTRLDAPKPMYVDVPPAMSTAGE